MVILTGGAGFIGSCLLKKLNDEGIKDIFIVDNLGNGEKWKNLIGKKFIEFIHKDEFLPMLIESNLSENIDAIIHLGACSTTTETDANYIIENNLNYSIKLANYAIEHDIKFLYASSAATYGDGKNGYSDKEFYNLKPLNIYGFSKHLFDLWVIDNGYDEIFTGVKFFNVFGPNEYHKGEMASMIYKSYLQIKNLGKVRLFKSNSAEFKDGEQKRDFIYIKDVIDVLWQMLNTENFAGIYNLGTGKARSWNDLVKSVFNVMGIDINIEYIDIPENLTKQYQNFTEADMTKLKTTGLKLNFSELEDTIHDYLNNYLLTDWQYY